MMLANDLKTYYDEVRRYLDCPKDEQDRLLLSVNKQVIELQVDNPNLDYDGIVEFLGEPESLAASLMERLSPDVVQKFKKKKRRLRLSIIACVAVVVVALSTLTIYTTTRQSNVHITEENYTFVDDNETWAIRMPSKAGGSPGRERGISWIRRVRLPHSTQRSRDSRSSGRKNMVGRNLLFGKRFLWAHCIMSRGREQGNTGG